MLWHFLLKVYLEVVEIFPETGVTSDHLEENEIWCCVFWTC